MPDLTHSAFCGTCKRTTLVRRHPGHSIDTFRCSVCEDDSTNRVTEAIYRIRSGGFSSVRRGSWSDVVDALKTESSIQHDVGNGKPVTISLVPGIVDWEVGRDEP